MRLQHVMAWVALVALASWGSSVALAQDASRGNTLYHSFPYQCDGCHGGLSPKNDPYANKPAQFPSGGVKTGASDWHYIQQGILYPVDGETDMTDALLGFYGDGLSGPITDQDLIDISAYLAGVFGGGGGGTPAISAPGSLSFTGAGSKSVSVSITGGTVAFNAPSISGANSGDFSISGNTCTGSKAPGSCQVSVTFTPGGSGTRSATLTISSNVGNALVSMSGPGTGGGGGGGAGQLQMPPNYDYGNQTVGTQSAPHAFTLTNTGGSSVSVSSVTSSDPANFPITSNGCTSVASGAACTINIAFAPQSAASPLSTITVTSNGTGSPQMFRITGTGTPPANPGQLAMPGPVTFAAQTVGTQSAAQTVTLTNTGGQSVTVSGVASSNAAEFPITANNCSTVAAGANCTISLAFKPSATGARNTTITVTSNGTGSPQSFTASGTGSAAATPGQLQMPGALNFGAQTLNVQSSAQTATITNIGGQSVTVSGVTSNNAAEFPVVSTTCTGAIAAGASCQASVAFKPSATGPRSAVITVTSNGAGSPQSFGASGSGNSVPQPGQLSVPDSLTLPSTPVGSQSAPSMVSASNVGGASVNVISVSSANASEFTVVSDNCSGSALQPGATCQFGVIFKPAASGVRSASLSIASNGMGSPHFITASGNGTSGGGMSVNQQGLTGSWYQPSTSGQGVEIEVYQDLVSAGTGFLQGSWFTFDSGAAGGASSQRWYTFSGNAPSGQASATFTLYQNVGGNFNALPVTSAVAVGTVTLNFTDCNSASMNYAFTDGSGRSGSIALVRLTPNVTCSANGSSSPNADFGYSGNWYDASKGGQGLVFELNPNAGVLFYAWYTYAPGGQSQGAAGQRWYTGQTTFTPGSRTLATTLYETTGGVFNSTTPAPHTVPVGTATVTFTSCAAAQLNFTFTGGSSAGASGTINLTRVGPVPAGCGP